MKCRVVEVQFRDILVDGDGQTVTYSPGRWELESMSVHDKGDSWSIRMCGKRTWKRLFIRRWIEAAVIQKDVIKDILISR